MKEVNKTVSELFENRKDLKVLYAFEDGSIFSNESFAKMHERSTKKGYTTYTRQPDASNDVDKGLKPIQDELLNLNLNELDGSQQPKLLKLAKGLNLKVANNKFETLVASLTEEKNRLTLNEQ